MLALKLMGYGALRFIYKEHIVSYVLGSNGFQFSLRKAFVDLSPLKRTTSPIHNCYCGTARKQMRMWTLKLMGYGALSYIH